MALKKGNEIPTIDVALVTVGMPDNGELAIHTASKIGISPISETVDAVKLVIKGRLIAQKGETVTLTGNTIVLTDNVFIPELVKMLQGGVIKYWTTEEQTTEGDTDMGFGVSSYTPPLSGSNEKGQPFPLHAYSAIYDSAGLITGYEKISYPNCQGTPIALNSEDNVFRAPEYTINSAPKQGEAPYKISYVKALPAIT